MIYKYGYNNKKQQAKENISTDFVLEAFDFKSCGLIDWCDDGIELTCIICNSMQEFKL